MLKKVVSSAGVENEALNVILENYFNSEYFPEDLNELAKEKTKMAKKLDDVLTYIENCMDYIHKEYPNTPDAIEQMSSLYNTFCNLRDHYTLLSWNAKDTKAYIKHLNKQAKNKGANN